MTNPLFPFLLSKVCLFRVLPTTSFPIFSSQSSSSSPSRTCIHQNLTRILRESRTIRLRTRMDGLRETLHTILELKFWGKDGGFFFLFLTLFHLFFLVIFFSTGRFWFTIQRSNDHQRYCNMTMITKKP